MQKDEQIIAGLLSGSKDRAASEKLLYMKFDYFIREGCRKYRLSQEDSFSAYSDAVLATILNVVGGRFDQVSSLKTYVFRIFSNKCVDQVRKNSINKQQVNQTTIIPELLGFLPDKSRSAVESLIDRQKKSLVQENLEKIGQKCKEILLFFEDGYSDREIAEKLEYNNAAVVKTTRLRCLNKMKEMMHHIMNMI